MLASRRKSRSFARETISQRTAFNLCILPTSWLFCHFFWRKLSQPHHRLSTAEDMQGLLLFFLVLALGCLNSRYHRVFCPTRKSWHVNKAVLNAAGNKAAV